MARRKNLNRTLYQGLAVAVVAAIAASTAVLIAAIAISSGERGGKPPVSDAG
jgi:hypothetical protein